MSTIQTKQIVSAPLASAGRLLQIFIDAHEANPSGGVKLLLHARNLERDAIVTLVPAHRPQDMTPRFTVHWESAEGGPYPVFDGILTIEAADDYDVFKLALEGTYQPPMGLAGKAFDAVIGNRIAEQTARELLSEMAGVMEARVQDEEAAKRR